MRCFSRVSACSNWTPGASSRRRRRRQSHCQRASALWRRTKRCMCRSRTEILTTVRCRSARRRPASPIAHPAGPPLEWARGGSHGGVARPFKFADSGRGEARGYALASESPLEAPACHMQAPSAAASPRARPVCCRVLAGHQDFQRYRQKPSQYRQPLYSLGPVTGMVRDTLGRDGKPVCMYDRTVAAEDVPVHERTISNCTGFHEWYHDSPLVETGCFSVEARAQMLAVRARRLTAGRGGVPRAGGRPRSCLLRWPPARPAATTHAPSLHAPSLHAPSMPAPALHARLRRCSAPRPSGDRSVRPRPPARLGRCSSSATRATCASKARSRSRTTRARGATRSTRTSTPPSRGAGCVTSWG